MRRLKAAAGGASAPEAHLLEAGVLFLLVADVVANDRFVPAYSGDEITPCPEVLADKVALPSP